MHDVVITGGELIDGTGSQRYTADVGITNGRIAAIGTDLGPASRVINADGRIVAPGFVDIHTHYDVQGFWDPTLSPSALHGVTTVIGGNCGFSVAPLNEEAAGYLMRMLARVEGMPLEALEIGVPWDWRTTDEFLDRLDGQLAVNAGFMVGHSALRRVVMGPAATERTANASEVAQMQQLLRDGLAAGGLGFSSTWAANHSDAEGRPVPSRHADAAELVALASICREYEGTSLEFLPVSNASFTDEVTTLLVDMTVAAQRPLNWNVVHVNADTVESWMKKLEVGDKARERGGKVVALTIPLFPPVRVNFRAGFTLDTLPGWTEPMFLDPVAKLQLLSDPSARRRLDELAQQPSNVKHISNWADKVIVEAFTPATKKYEGQRVGDIAEAEGKDPFDALLDIVCADDLRTLFMTQPRPDTRRDWEARKRVWTDKRAVIGGSDAGAHVDMIATFNYPTVLLEHGVREQGLLELEAAVHLITEVPAQLYGLRDRGTLTVGGHADVVIFDAATIASEAPYTKADLPGGASRLYAGAKGIDHVLVNGVEIVQHGEFTGAIAGKLLRSGRDTYTPSLD